MSRVKNKSFRKIAFYITGILSQISPTLCSRIVYFCAHKRFLHLNPPENLNEKFMWLKLNIYNYHPLVRQCADKLAMREYVEKMGYGILLNTIYGVWDNADEIDFHQLPEKFVLKCNHGSGYNIICSNKDNLDIKATRNQLNAWMQEDYWKRSAELNYRYIPRKIICERFIESGASEIPCDYKVMCFNGEPQFILYCDGRGGKTRYLNYDIHWNLLPVNLSPCSETIQPPGTLKKMLEYSRVLSSEFPAVRLDYYDNDGELILGEMTFTPAGCISIAMTPEGLNTYGAQLDLTTDLTKKMRREALEVKRERSIGL